MHSFSKRLIAAVMVVSLLILYSPAALVAGLENGDVLALSFGGCEDRAAAKSIIKLNSSINSMRRTAESLKSMEDAAFLNIDTYKRLKVNEQQDLEIKLSMEEKMQKGEELTPGEQVLYDGALLELQMLEEARQGLLILGFNPDDLSDEEQYLHIIKPMRFQRMELEANIKNLSLNIDAASNSSKSAVRSLYDNILSLQDNLSVQQLFYKIQKQKYNIALDNFNNGKVSELDRFSAETDLKKAELSEDILRRNLDNLYLMLKKETGIEISQKVEIKPYEKDQEEKILEYDKYLSSALSNRYEILSAMNSLEVKQNELKIAADYVGTASPEYKEILNSVTEYALKLQQAEIDVTRDIKLGFSDALKKQRSVESLKKKMDNAKMRLDELNKRFSMGSIPDAMVQDAEIAYNQAYAAYKKGILDYNTAIYRLKLASGIGPGYTAGR